MISALIRTTTNHSQNSELVKLKYRPQQTDGDFSHDAAYENIRYFPCDLFSSKIRCETCPEVHFFTATNNVTGIPIAVIGKPEVFSIFRG